MNYTNHYHSDYMMKLRHIGNQLIEDKEFEQKLNEKIELIDLRNIQSSKVRKQLQRERERERERNEYEFNVKRKKFTKEMFLIALRLKFKVYIYFASKKNIFELHNKKSLILYMYTLEKRISTIKYKNNQIGFIE